MQVEYRKEKSFFGISVPILKSGICKYFRRDENEKFEWCVVEMSLFGTIEKGDRLVSNLINRLKILLMEDLSLFETGRILRGIELLKKFETNRQNGEILVEFCRMLIGSRKSRAPSYVKNKWWDEVVESKNPEKIMKYVKKGDSAKLLELGEGFLECLKSNDERMVAYFLAVFRTDLKGGVRYRRKDGIYLFWEIMETKMTTPEMKRVFRFALEMFFRKSMKERVAFGVWMCMLVLKRDELDWTENTTQISMIQTDRVAIEMDDYVVNDFHVNRTKYSRKHFARVGAFVENEDWRYFGSAEKLEEIRTAYIANKDGDDESETEEDEKNEEKGQPRYEKQQMDLPVIAFKNLSILKAFDDECCGLKKPCLLVESTQTADEKYVVKEFGKGLNYGKDYTFVDGSKKMFGLNDLELVLYQADFQIVRDGSIRKTFRGNWKIADKNSVIGLMKYRDNIGCLSRNKQILENPEMRYEMLKIRLFDGLFQSSDNNLRNILVQKDENQKLNLVSIDEGDIFGKRKLIFDKNEWKRLEKIGCSKSMIGDICAEFKKVDIDEIVRKMRDAGLEKFEKEMRVRFENYEMIVMSEIE